MFAQHKTVLWLVMLQVLSNNTFEQLCINLASEKVQKFTNHHIFQLEEVTFVIILNAHLLLHDGVVWTVVHISQRAHLKEGVVLEVAKFENNSECIDLITKPPTGIFHLLDQETASPKVRRMRKEDKEICHNVCFCFALGNRYILSREMSHNTPNSPILCQAKEEVKQVWD